MVYIEKQIRDNKYYYYLTYSMRFKENKFKKIRMYLKSSIKELSEDEENNLILDNLEKFDDFIDLKFPNLATDYDINIFFKNPDTLFLKSDLINIEIVSKRFQKIKENLDHYNNLRENFVILHSHNSTKVEGNTLTKKDTILLLTKGIMTSIKELREANEVLNISHAIDFIENYNKELTVDFICKIHSIVTKNTLLEARNEGVLRQEGINVIMGNSDFRCVPGGKMIQQSLVQAIKAFNDLYKKDKLGAIVRFYAAFIAIHPFIDGNGRTSRIILNYLIKNEKLPFINYDAKKHIEHIEGIDKAIRGKGFNLLSEFILDLILNNDFTSSPLGVNRNTNK